MTSSDTTVRIGEITHGRSGCWVRDDEGRIQSKTRCGVLYTYKRHEVSAKVPFGEGIISQDVDCMACLVAESRW